VNGYNLHTPAFHGLFRPGKDASAGSRLFLPPAFPVPDGPEKQVLLILASPFPLSHWAFGENAVESLGQLQFREGLARGKVGGGQAGKQTG
jgi:hypothetical protein